MADDFTFDIVSKVDLQVIDDVINTCNKEIQVRFDFRGSSSRFEFDKKTSQITLHSDDEGKLKSVVEILRSRLAKRSVDQKVLDFQKLEQALGAKVRQVVKVKQGIETEKAKAIVADIKSSKLKVTPSIQGDQLRVSSKSKDSLQEAMALIRGKDYGIALQFTNYR